MLIEYPDGYQKVYPFMCKLRGLKKNGLRPDKITIAPGEFLFNTGEEITSYIEGVVIPCVRGTVEISRYAEDG